MFYRYIEEKLYNPEIGYYVAFGIEVKVSAEGGTIKKESDLFLCKEKAVAFAELLNEFQPELTHFEELCQSAVE